MMIQAVARGGQPAHYTNLLWLLLRAHGVESPEMVVLEDIEKRMRAIETQRQFTERTPNVRPRVMSDLERTTLGQNRRP